MIERQNRRTARRGLRLGALALALLALALIGPPSASASRNPFKGDASWVWYVSSSGGSGEAIGAAAEKSGLDAVYVKSGDATNYWSQFSSRLVDEIHAHGVKVCAWQFVYGDDPAGEARTAARAVDAGADCLIIDAESAYEGRYAEADTYMRKLRALVGKAYPLGLSSFPYVDYHGAFPYSVFLGPGGAQYNLPQLYWYSIGDPLVTAFSHTYSYNRPYDRPIYPTGQTYEDPPRGQLRDFRRYARAFRAKGVAWWSWQETSRRELKAITKPIPRRVRGFKARNDLADVQAGSRGDLVVWAQELLSGAGHAVPITGDFGKRTRQAVEALQEEAGLPIDGVISDRTWRELLKNEARRVRWSERSSPGALRAGGASGPRSASMPPRSEGIPPGLKRGAE